MKTFLLAAMLLFTPSLLLAGDLSEGRDGNCLSYLDLPAEKQPRDFGVLLSSGVPSRQAARDLALTAWDQRIQPWQVARVVGLFRAAKVAGSGIAGFAAPGHWVWEVHIGSMTDLNGVVFIDAQTKKAHVFPTTNAKP